MAARRTLRPDGPRAASAGHEKSINSRVAWVAYFAILLAGFLLWIGYGAAAGLPALIIPNIVATLVGTAVIAVALRLRQ